MLLRLDATQIRAELGVIRSQVLEMSARCCAWPPSATAAPDWCFPMSSSTRGADARAAADGETRLFDETRRAKDSQKEQFKLKIEQSQEEIIGLTGNATPRPARSRSSRRSSSPFAGCTKSS